MNRPKLVTYRGRGGGGRNGSKFLRRASQYSLHRWTRDTWLQTLFLSSTTTLRCQSVSQKQGRGQGCFSLSHFYLHQSCFWRKRRKREMGKKRSVAGEAKTSRSHEVGVLKTTKCFNNGLPPRNPQGPFFLIISFSTLLFNYRMTYLDGLFSVDRESLIYLLCSWTFYVFLSFFLYILGYANSISLLIYFNLCTFMMSQKIKMIYTQNCGMHVLVLLFMYRELVTRFSTSLRVTWNRFCFPPFNNIALISFLTLTIS